MFSCEQECLVWVDVFEYYHSCANIQVCFNVGECMDACAHALAYVYMVDDGGGDE